MKFYFKRRKAAGPKRSAKKLILKRKAEDALIRFCALEKNIEVDLFDDIDAPSKKRGIFSSISSLFKKISKSLAPLTRKLGKRPPARSALLLGALFGISCVCLIAGAFTVFSLFGAHLGRYETVTIPNLVSLSKNDAINTDSDIFEYEIIYSYNPSANEDSVISQTPRAGVSRKLYNADGKIKLSLLLNSQRQRVTLPNLVGASARDAELFLKNSGATVKIFEEYSDYTAKGKVVACSHPEGTQINNGEIVVLRVSKGAQTVYAPLPSLLGMGESEAIKKLESLGFSVGKITYSQSRSEIGTVISQEYEKGTQLPIGTKISITISGGLYFE